MIEVPFEYEPSYKEFQENKPSDEEMFRVTNEATKWYNTAPKIAARLFIKSGIKNPNIAKEFAKARDYRETMVEEDEETWRKIEKMELSSVQGGSAENIAKKFFKDNVDNLCMEHEDIVYIDREEKWGCPHCEL